MDMDWKKQTISLMLAGCMTASALPAAFAVEAQVETPVPVSEPVTAQPEVTAPAQDIQQETPQPAAQAEVQPEVNAPKTADEQETAIVSAQAAQPQMSVQGAASGKCGTNLTWTLDDKGTLTISGTGEMDNYSSFAPWHASGKSIKSVVIKPGVTSIGDSAFSYCGSLKSITIPNSVTSIGDQAFCACERLTGITLPNRVTSIGDNAFERCRSLTGITIGNGVTRIGEYAFFGCDSLTSITIPNSVTRIGDSAFSGCGSLTSITIPNGVTSIGDGVFYGCESLTGITIGSGVTRIGEDAFDCCSSLTSITVDGRNQAYSSENGVLFDKKKTELIHCPQKKSGKYVIPNSVTRIGDWAFSDCDGLTGITIPNSVTRIGDWAFSDCDGLTGVTIPNSVTSIGEYAFFLCNSLTSITVDQKNQVYSSENGVLFNKKKTELICCPEKKSGKYVIPNSVTCIGNNAFQMCDSLTGVTIPSSVKSIGMAAFAFDNKLKTIYFCGDVPEILESDPQDEEEEYANERSSVLNEGLRDSPVFEEVTATAYYPQGNRTWTESARERFGGDITWKTWNPGDAKELVPQVFPDVPANAWYVNAVQYAYDNNIMAGTGGKFLPNGTMTRAMVVQTLYNISGKPAVSGKPGFSDIKTTDWYFKAVLWAEQNKVAAGSNGKFNPNGLVTREQFAQFLYNYAGTPKVSGALRGFADTASVSGWAKKALTWANQNGVVSGKPSGGKLYLDPKGRATRAEAAAMLMKYQKM